jgi:hypothetical protein
MSVSNQYGFNGFPIPIGSILPFAGLEVPRDYLVCDGGAFDAGTYPVLAQVLGAATTPNLVNAFLGGATQRTPAVPFSISGVAAPLSLDPENIPSFTAGTVASSSFSGTMTKGQRADSTQQGVNGGGGDFLTGDPTSQAIILTVTSIDATYNGGEQPAIPTAINITNVEPSYVEIQYIIKAL